MYSCPAAGSKQPVALIRSEPLQEAISTVMRILTVALVVGVAIRRIWALAGAMAEAIVSICRKEKSEESHNQEGD